MSTLCLDDIEYSYRQSKAVLQGVSFDVPDQSIVALVGRNGAGKSTLFDLCIGLLRPSSGALELGRPGAEIAYLPQILAPSPYLTIAETIRAFAAIEGVSDASLTQRVLEKYEAGGDTETGNRFDQKGTQWSYGECRLLFLFIQLSLPHKTLLLFDEPTSGLDVGAKSMFWSNLQKNTSASLLWSTHNLGEIDQISDQVVLLENGRSESFDSTGHLAASRNKDSVADVFDRSVG